MVRHLRISEDKRLVPPPRLLEFGRYKLIFSKPAALPSKLGISALSDFFATKAYLIVSLSGRLNLAYSPFKKQVKLRKGKYEVDGTH
jgi:hypothetical protein